MKNRLLIALGWGALLSAAAPPVSFVPVEPRFAPAAEEYRRLWHAEGARMIAALEAATGLAFPKSSIEVLVTAGPSMTAYDGRSMRLHASYPAELKKAALVHELGHSLAFTLPRGAGMDDHRFLFLFLHDVLSDLYGPDFAKRVVAIERRSSSHYDYGAAWDWALAMTRSERQARLRRHRLILGGQFEPGEDRRRR